MGHAHGLNLELWWIGGMGFGMWAPGLGLDLATCWVSTKRGQFHISIHT